MFSFVGGKGCAHFEAIALGEFLDEVILSSFEGAASALITFYSFVVVFGFSSCGGVLLDCYHEVSIVDFLR